MSNLATPIPAQATASDEASDPRVEQTFALIRTLLGSLPAQEQERFAREMVEKMRLPTAPRAGEVLGTLIRLLPQQKSWSVAELKEQIEERGVSASPKQVFNALGYLVRKKRVTRLGYGRYMVDGALLVTADDLGGQPSITEGDLDD
jgi:hypothetical protein